MAVYLGKDKIAGISTSQPAENNNLKLPEVAPGVQQIVGINADGTQQNLILGEGLSIVDGTIKASGGSGGGKLYNHQISLSQAQNGSITIVNTSPELFTKVTLPKWLYDNGYKGKKLLFNTQCIYPVIGEIKMDGSFTIPVGIYSRNGERIGLFTHEFDVRGDIVENRYNDNWYDTLGAVTDTVSEL